MDFPFQPEKLISIKHTFSERQRELKRIGNMIDDIIASKWSRTMEKTARITAQNVRHHKSDISCFSQNTHFNLQAPPK